VGAMSGADVRLRTFAPVCKYKCASKDNKSLSFRRVRRAEKRSWHWFDLLESGGQNDEIRVYNHWNSVKSLPCFWIFPLIATPLLVGRVGAGYL